jgi:tetratricopeptide (TPR) repeat protein
VSALPDTVEGVIAVQIDRLPPLDRRVLRIASVLGVRIEGPVLRQILLADGVDPAGALERLDGFLDNDGADGWRFRHTLARDTAYEGLPFSRRQLLHGLAGEVIEQLAGARADDEAGLLSLHFLHARRFEAAWLYARLAGQQAQQVHAQVEAAEFYERALDAAKRLGSAVSGEVATVAEALGDAHYKLGAFAEAASAYASARAVSANEVDHARLCYKSSLVADRVGQLGNALRWLTKAGRLLRDSVDPEAARLRAQCRAQHGVIRHWQGRDTDAALALRDAVELAEQANADDAVANALVWLDLAVGQSGTGEHARRALEIWRKLGNLPWEEARVLNMLGIRAYFEGRWDLAVDYYAQSRQACERAGDQFTGAVESGNMAEVLSDQGHLVEAETLLREAMRIWRAAAAPSFIAFGRSQLGRLAARSGRFDEAAELLQSAREDYLRDGEQSEVLETEARLAECLLLQGADVAAVALADETLARMHSIGGMRPQLPMLQRIRGLGLARLGDFAGARAALEVSLRGARERRARHEVAWTLLAILDVCRAQGEALDADVQAEQSSLFEQLGIVSAATPEPAPRQDGDGSELPPEGTPYPVTIIRQRQPKLSPAPQT